MTDETPLDRALTDLARSVEGTLSAHPDADLFLAHQRGELSPRESAALEEHVAWCRECAELWHDAAAFAAGEAEPSDPEEKRADWEALQALRTGGEEPPDKELPRPDGKTTLHRRYSPAIAALLAVALGGAGFWIVNLNGRLEEAHRPRANVPIVDLTPASAPKREGAATLPQIDLGRATIVILNPSVIPKAESYQVSVLDSRDRTVWMIPGLVATGFGNFTLELPAGSLDPGLYRLILKTETGREIETFQLRVSGS